MLDSETIACLRRVLDEVCKGGPLQETGTRAHVASKILEAASRGETSVDGEDGPAPSRRRYTGNGRNR
ncbi:hypothetical protein [Bradyrhizobium tropiciagri]|uniref:hypothetical protein n=1 Tax=Bradyrhizobium tropiciagri TaxID=312253 RepID=UPI001009E69F|nr:hypothetical protein [Bradyrhizobium tropiciagri]